ncbi:hypothetical protein SNEBB_007334 [Seison nebaliae]|nr:hypothetical protein SNEBB_007334 [Seison nebaliae]
MRRTVFTGIDIGNYKTSIGVFVNEKIHIIRESTNSDYRLTYAIIHDVHAGKQLSETKDLPNYFTLLFNHRSIGKIPHYDYRLHNIIANIDWSAPFHNNEDKFLFLNNAKPNDYSLTIKKSTGAIVIEMDILLAIFFLQIRQAIEDYFETNNLNIIATINVPIWFNSRQRECFANGAKGAEFTSYNLISSTTANLIYWQLQMNGRSSNFLTAYKFHSQYNLLLELSDKNFLCCLFEIDENGKLKIIHEHVGWNCGGRFYDYKMFNELPKLKKTRYNFGSTRSLQLKRMNIIKHALSIPLEQRYSTVVQQFEPVLDTIFAPLINEIENGIKSCLKKSELHSIHHLKHIVACGGGFQLEFVRNKLKEILDGIDVEYYSEWPHTVMYGCAIHAYLKAIEDEVIDDKKMSNYGRRHYLPIQLLGERTFFPLNIMMDNLSFPIIHEHTVLPITIPQTLFMKDGGFYSFRINLHDGKHMLTAKNRPILSFSLISMIEMIPRGSPIKIVLTLNENGMIEMKATFSDGVDINLIDLHVEPKHIFPLREFSSSNKAEFLENYNSIRKRFPSLFNINDELEDVEETSRKDLSVVSSEPEKDDPIETDTFYASGSESGDNAEADSIRE